MSAPNKSYDPVEVAVLSAAEVQRMLDEALAAINGATSLEELKAARIAHAGDRAPVTLANAEIGALPPAARAEAGKRVGAARGAIRTALAQRQDVLEAERELYGWDHCEIGRQLIADWKLPANFEAVVADHLAPRRADGAWDVSELVKVSCAMASSVGFAAFPRCQPTPFADLLASLPDRERHLFQADPDTLNREIAESIHTVESL